MAWAVEVRNLLPYLRGSAPKANSETRPQPQPPGRQTCCTRSASASSRRSILPRPPLPSRREAGRPRAFFGSYAEPEARHRPHRNRTIATPLRALHSPQSCQTERAARQAKRTQKWKNKGGPKKGGGKTKKKKRKDSRPTP